MKPLSFLLAVIALVSACTPREKTLGELNPAAIGFDSINSDPAAIQLADSIMAAMGGRENWDKTRFISMEFFRAQRPDLG
jgi:hypothetical protein